MMHLARTGLLLLVILELSCGGRTVSWLDSAVDRDSSRIDASPRRERGIVPERFLSPDAAVNLSLFAALFVDHVAADCMPVVPPDPVVISGHMELLNNGTIAVGPIKLTSGRLVEYKTNQELGTFALKPITAVVIKPGEGLSPKIEKSAGSMKPDIGCQICGKMVRVEITFTGAGLPAKTKVLSGAVQGSCSY